MAGTWIDLPLTGGGGSAFWGDPVPSFANLPPVAQNGEVRLVLDTHELYYFDSADSTWKPVPTSVIDPNDVADTDSVDLTVTAGILSADVRLSSNAADTGFIVAEANVESTGVHGIRIQVADSLVRSLFDGDGTYITYDDTTGVFGLDTDSVKALFSGDGTYISYDPTTGTFSLEVQPVRELFSSTTTAIDYDNTNGEFTLVPGEIDHGDLAGLTDDTHPQYALLAGRTTGQTLNGGSASGGNLVLSSTSNGTKGNVQIPDPLLLPVRTSVQIAALTPIEGMVVFDSTLSRPLIYLAGATNAWVYMVGWGSPTV